MSQAAGPSVTPFLVCALLLLIFVIGNSFRSPADDPRSTRLRAAEGDAVRVAVGFLEAYGTLDADRATRYLAPDADISLLIRSVGADGVDGTLREFSLLVELLKAWRYEQEVRSCDQTATADAGTVVRCHFDYHFLGSDELVLDSYTGSSFDVTVLDGEIVRLSKVWAFDRFSAEMWEPFAAWVSKAYPRDAARMYEDYTHRGVRLAPGSIRRWERHTREYVRLRAGVEDRA